MFLFINKKIIKHYRLLSLDASKPHWIVSNIQVHKVLMLTKYKFYVLIVHALAIGLSMSMRYKQKA